MKKEDILELPEGNEVDALVAEKVMGWHKGDNGFGSACWLDSNNVYKHPLPRDGYEDDEDFHLICWHPSGSILWAWDVIEKFENRCMLNNVHGVWECYLPDGATGKAKTASLAICRAALAAKL